MHIEMKSFECLFGMRSLGLDVQCRLLGSICHTSGVHWLTPASFAFEWHQPMQKVITRTLWMGKTGFRGSWAIPSHQIQELLHSVSEKHSVLKRKGYVYTEQTCNICSWGGLASLLLCDFWWRKIFGSLECHFHLAFQRASTGSLKSTFSVVPIITAHCQPGVHGGGNKCSSIASF